MTKGPLTLALFGAAAATNGNLYGYFAGGTGNPPNYSTVNRIDYSNDTVTASAKGPLSVVRARFSAVSNGKYGWFLGGIETAYPYLSSVDRIDFSNDTATGSVRGHLNTGAYATGATSASDNALSVGLQGVTSNTSFANVPVGTNSGYWSGGYQPANSPSFPSAVYYSTVSRLDFDNDTTTGVTKGPLPNVLYRHSATGNTSHGYLGWGSPGSISTVNRMDYSNDSASPTPRGPLSNTKYRGAAVSNSNFGWFMGGSPSYVTTVNRIEYASDTATAVVRGPLANGKDRASVTGTIDYAYRGGGYNWPAPVYIRSDVERIDYSNDTATAVVKSALSVRRSELGAAGNANFGYWAGGYNVIPGGNNWVSTIDRIDFTSDTTTAVVKGQLSQTRGSGTNSSTGNKNYGYIGSAEGGNDENISTLDRIDYSNDTATSLVRGPLTLALRESAACSPRGNTLPTERLYSTTLSNIGNEEVSGTRNPTPNHGYFGGGYNPSAVQSGINRIDLSNDTATASQVSQFAGASPSYRNQLRTLFGVANLTHAYWGGGTHGLGSESTSIFVNSSIQYLAIKHE